LQHNCEYETSPLPKISFGIRTETAAALKRDLDSYRHGFYEVSRTRTTVRIAEISSRSQFHVTNHLRKNFPLGSSKSVAEIILLVRIKWIYDLFSLTIMPWEFISSVCKYRCFIQVSTLNRSSVHFNINESFLWHVMTRELSLSLIKKDKEIKTWIYFLQIIRRCKTGRPKTHEDHRHVMRLDRFIN